MLACAIALLPTLLPAQAAWLPVHLETVASTRDAHSRYDGSFFQGRGLQTRLRFGARARFGPLRAQVAPEWIRHADLASADWYRFESAAESRVYITRSHNFIDLPERVGNGQSTRWSPGESFLELRLWALSARVSSQTQRLGPGIRNSLLLTDQAEGFPHLAFESHCPIKTPIGGIRFKWMGGYLSTLVESDPLLDRLESVPGYIVKRGEDRYFTTLTAQVQPVFLPGLWVGATRSFLMYRSALEGWQDYLPMFQAFTKDNFQTDDNVRGNDAADQKLVGHFQWRFPESGLELYGEWGREDHALDMRDIIGQPDHTRAYVVGLRKIHSLSAQREVVTVVEQAVLHNTNSYRVRATGSWYGHNLIREGHTHKSQLLGSALGPGGSGQYLSIHASGPTRGIGFELERAVRDRDLQVEFRDITRKPWVDLSFGLNYRMQGRLATVRVAGYVIHSRNAYYDDRTDRTFVQSQVGLEIPLDR